MSTSKITVDLRAKTFTIEVPDDKVESILDKIEALFENAPEDRPPLDPHTAPNAEGVKDEASPESDPSIR